MAKLLEKVSRLPDNSAIFYLLVFHDGHGQRLTPFQAAQRISARANAPVFSHWKTLMGSGILGGYLLSGERIGKIAARSVTAHAKGEPFTFNPQEVYGNYYDWQQLTSWGIDKKKLPADAVLLNRPPGIWEYYKWQIVSISVFLFIVMLVSFLCYRNSMIKKVNQELNLLSATDSLTGLLNRRAIKALITKEMHRKKLFKQPVSFLLLDLDRFKQVNDQHGHATGDKVLVEIAKTAKALIRNTDNIARWGGEEFAILAANTDISHALVLAEKIRKAVMAVPFQGVQNITVSIGVAEYHPEENFQQWYERTDCALYRAKRKGRNQVVADQCTFTSNLRAENRLRAAWKKDFFSGHPVIDKQHIELIDQTNHLLDAILTYADEHTIDTVVDNLFRSLKEHFTYEEQILAQIKYPQLQHHKDEHLRLLTQSEELIDQFKIGRVDILVLIKFISQYVVEEHLTSEDKDYFKWLNNILSATITQ
ncbi:MAG: diguanylate cyclase [Candidatus Electrothrix sp. AR1]|nr:diguanylate cyclase [Candidatus Electrothrix sp. AR1]